MKESRKGRARVEDRKKEAVTETNRANGRLGSWEKQKDT